MVPYRLRDGRIVIPRRAEGPNGVIGDGVVTIDKGDPAYKVWDEYLARSNK